MAQASNPTHEEQATLCAPGEPRSVIGGNLQHNTSQLFRWPPLLYTFFWFIEPSTRHTAGDWLQFACYYALFLTAYLRVFSRTEKYRKLWLGLLFLLGYAYFPFDHATAGEWVYPIVMSVFFLRQPRVSAALGRFALILLASAAAIWAETHLLHAHPAIFRDVMFYAVAVGLSNFAYSRHLLAGEQLQRANQEIEHLAQMAERERIARDLHDLLGHTLTVITLKADLANRLFDIDPERAHREIAEVEQTARKALIEVREAVSGYRAEGFAAELAQARRSLLSASVQLTTNIEPLPLTDAATHVLSLLLREAVTNVIRHAGATACRVELGRNGALLRLIVEDNGRGGGTEGNGLRGMRERLAADGGTLFRESADSGGTRLRAELPIAEVRRSGPRPELTGQQQPAYSVWRSA